MSSSNSNMKHGVPGPTAVPGNPANQGSQTYLRNMVMTASPGELRLMLLDGAIRFAEQTKRGYEERNFELSYEGTTRAQAILLELMNSLRPDQSPDLCSKLSSLYMYLYKRLVEASLERDAAAVGEVVELLRFERETWQLCLQELTKENQSASRMQAIPRVNMTPTTPTGGSTLSISG